MRIVTILIVLVCLLAGSASAQSTDATITGRILNPNNVVIAGARVEVIDAQTNIRRSVETNEEGIYVVPNLKPGIYRIEVSKAGFKTIIKPDVTLHVQDVIAINFTLPIGSISESITVTGGAPAVNTESAAVGTVIDRQFVENIPLNGRSFQTLIALTPGTVVTKTDFNNQGQFSINGQRANANYFTVDGVSANIGISTAFTPTQVSGGSLPGVSASGGFNNLVSVDAMQEFRVQTSTYAPEFGRTPGGQVAIVTRPGTNKFHGALFQYFRNNVLDANDWFANREGLPKAPLRQNQFGGVFGGPILKNRSFFFFSYEGLRLRLPQTQTVLVPSMAARQAAPAEIQPLLNAYPIPNGAVFSDGSAEFSGSYSDPSSLDATSIRIDHTASSKLHIFGRFSHAPSDTKQREGSLSSRVATASETQTFTIGMTWGLSPTVNNEFRANYSRNDGKTFHDLDDFGGAVPLVDSTVFPASRSRQDSLFQLSFFSGVPTALQLGRAAENAQRQVNLVDSLSVVAGAHHLKFGIDYRWLSPIINRGSGYSLTPAFTDLSAFPGGALSGNTLLTFVDGFEEVGVVFHNFSAYAQDTWRVTPRLILTYGLRWEVNPAPRGRDGKGLFTFDNIDDLTMLSVAPEGTPLFETRFNNIAPRIGSTYRLSTKQGRELVVRGGFGVFHDLGSGGLADVVTFPYVRTKSLLLAPFPLTPQQAEAPPVSLDPPFFTSVADRELKLPYTYHWNVSLEQSLGTSQTLSASYVGAAGRRLLRRENLSGGLADFLLVTRNKATSDYHALQVQFNRRLSRGLRGLASYTWSHSIDISSSDTAQNNIPANLTDVNIDRGSSDFDVRHSFNAALTYDLPAPNAGRIGKAILSNWSVDGIFFARTAPPVNLIGGTAFMGGFFAPVRPDLVPGVTLEIEDRNSPGGKRFNPAAFAPPPTDMFGSALRQGDLGRNVMRGFGAWQLDLALRRQFHLTEQVHLQFRAEFFNLFNHPNFGDPEARVGSPRFGESTQMLGRSLGSGGSQGGFNPLYQIGGPRSIQFAARLQF